jgi:hypothetical protein
VRPLQIRSLLERELHLAAHRLGKLGTGHHRNPAQGGSHPRMRLGEFRFELHGPAVLLHRLRKTCRPTCSLTAPEMLRHEVERSADDAAA